MLLWGSRPERAGFQPGKGAKRIKPGYKGAEAGDGPLH